MAKYRNHTTSHHDILLGYTDPRVPSTDADFTEDDVWTMSDRYGWSKPNPNRTKPKQTGRTQSGGLSLTFDSPSKTDPAAIHQCRHVAASSAPMDVPVWSRMARVESSDSMISSVELEPDEEESEWVPPHEYLAREHGKSVTTSVFEGAGRTLKGRDLRRVRDAVWSRTGFFG